MTEAGGRENSTLVSGGSAPDEALVRESQKRSANFREANVASGFVFPFDSVASGGQEGEIATSSDGIPSADLLTLRKILTVFARQEESSDGFIPTVCSDGRVQRVIERLQQLRPPGTVRAISPEYWTHLSRKASGFGKAFSAPAVILGLVIRSRVPRS